MLIRHQSVRDRGVPRVTTLVGELAVTRGAWQRWLEHTGRTPEDELVQAEPSRGAARWLPKAARAALTAATAEPHRPHAILVSSVVWQAWATARGDRVRAFLDEGLVELGTAAPTVATPSRPPPPRTRRSAPLQRARSRAEVALFEALEGTPSTAGRFVLNASVTFVFGAQAAEVDLLSRADDLAIEIDGYHHFTDADHYRRDRRKDLLLQAHGYIVLRFLAEDVTRDPAEAVRAVLEILGAHRRRELRARRKNPA